MKVFQSLNCVVCKLPFARKANEARSPRRSSCGPAMCHECFEKERLLEKEERKHQCVRKPCFTNPNFAFYLIDVLSQEDSLALSPLGDGYLLVKPFKIPECPICHDEYSNQVDGKKSRSLFCNHLIYFLNELPMMTRQMDGRRNHRVCDDCKETGIIDKMYHCSECDLKICSDCLVEEHRSHETTRLLKNELCEMSEAQQKDSTQMVKTYNDLFALMHENTLKGLEAFGTKLTLKEENSKSISTFGEAKKTLEKCAKLREDFETISEKLMPHLRRYETKVKTLTERIDKDDYQGLKDGFEE
ncbi:unnamed protein product, partial [Mesorhabditis belari]|uniref:B box-type domain-containing protein n=1 Tax=Mesorhabditis belari TaxID=2138241 RepID=A0AAF3EKX0_9BILA